MANQVKSRKPITARNKALICLVILCALTVAASVLGLNGWRSGENGMNVLLPWVPTSSGSWPQSLPLTKALDGGTYTDYAVTLAEGETLDGVMKTMKAHLDGIGETDSNVSAQGSDTIRMEIRKMDSSRQQFLRSVATLKGQITFAASTGEQVLTEKDIQSAALGVNSTQTSYVYNIVLTDEGAQKAADSGASYMLASLDGDQIGYAYANGNALTLYFSNNNYITYVNLARSADAVYSTMTMKGSGDLAATAPTAKTVVFFAGAILLIGALVYLCLTRKLTGLAGAWTVWCAALLGLFFVATLVVISVYALNVGCLIAMLLGILLAVYTAVTRADAISANIAAGQSPKQASRLGFKAAAKPVWIAHGAVLLLALLMMLIPVAKSTGYTLAAMVCGSAITAVLMRAFQACFTAMTGKPSLFGKAE